MHNSDFPNPIQCLNLKFGNDLVVGSVSAGNLKGFDVEGIDSGTGANESLLGIVLVVRIEHGLVAQICGIEVLDLGGILVLLEDPPRFGRVGIVLAAQGMVTFGFRVCHGKWEWCR